MLGEEIVMTDINRWIRPDLRALQAYTVTDATGLIKLDAMESPYPWPLHLRDEWLARLNEVELNRYPDPRGQGIKQRLRNLFAVPSELALLLGNGSDEIIQLVLLAMSGPNRSVVAPVPSFVMYRLISQWFGLRFVGVPLRSDFSLDLAGMLQAIAEHEPAVVFIAQPNNPTGNAFSRDDIQQIIAAAPGLVVLDEAYFPFCDTPLLDLAGGSVLVMRTLSKLGMAGLRLGVLIGDAAWLNELDKLRLPYNVNSLTQASAEFALDHWSDFAMLIDQICHSRNELIEKLQQLSGVHVFATQANFVLIRVPDAPTLFTHLKQQGVLIKNLHQPLLTEHCLRLTVGSPSENHSLINALKIGLGNG